MCLCVAFSDPAAFDLLEKFGSGCEVNLTVTVCCSDDDVFAHQRWHQVFASRRSKIRGLWNDAESGDKPWQGFWKTNSLRSYN